MHGIVLKHNYLFLREASHWQPNLGKKALLHLKFQTSRTFLDGSFLPWRARLIGGFRQVDRVSTRINFGRLDLTNYRLLVVISNFSEVIFEPLCGCVYVHDWARCYHTFHRLPRSTAGL